jgi:hypothetical protein
MLKYREVFYYLAFNLHICIPRLYDCLIFSSRRTHIDQEASFEVQEIHIRSNPTVDRPVDSRRCIPIIAEHRQ